MTRLPALDARGIAAATVAAASARIGDARSTYEDGILSRVNRGAAALGIAPGISAREFVADRPPRCGRTGEARDEQSKPPAATAPRAA